jgi:hypothetical protein
MPISSLIREKSGARGTQIPKIGYCAEKIRLLGEFLESIREFTDLQNQQTQAVIDAAANSDADFTRFGVLLHIAQDKKDRAKYAWIAHVEEHGCQEGSTDQCD